jgi:peptidoglycan/xylan/chitin deacetylase (PgdA/CDA1 family)
VRHHQFPKWLKRFYPRAIWDFSHKEHDKKVLYLTFDDGPCPETTPWLLDLLKTFGAKATFFCVGKNVADHPALVDRLNADGHTLGNHSFSHLNGFQVNTNTYIKDILKAEQSIQSNLFRPPYGRLTPHQHRKIKQLGYRTVFWSHISYDFDADLDRELRIKKTIEATKPGAVMVFHDSAKAFPQLKHELPQLLKHWANLGYEFARI